jgi:hypothetical protein
LQGGEEVLSKEVCEDESALCISCIGEQDCEGLLFYDEGEEGI